MARDTDGLSKWFKENWVDIGSKKKGGGYEKCGRKSAKGSKENTQNVFQLLKLHQ